MRRAITLLLVLLLLGAAARATMLKRLTLGEVEGHASEIFVGRVRAMRTIQADGPRNLLFTEVDFVPETVVKGEPTLPVASYRFAGGTIGSRTLRVVGMPEFELDARYVLFANAKVDRICPVIGWWQGRYVVETDARGDYVCDSDGRPVYGLEDGFPRLKPAEGEDAPMRLTAFLGAVREIVRKREAAEEARPDAEEER